MLNTRWKNDVNYIALKAIRIALEAKRKIPHKILTYLTGCLYTCEARTIQNILISTNCELNDLVNHLKLKSFGGNDIEENCIRLLKKLHVNCSPHLYGDLWDLMNKSYSSIELTIFMQDYDDE